MRLTSGVEKRFFELSGLKENEVTGRVPYILVDNFPRLGFLTALRFIEWVSMNPGGVVSLPTGKTPEYFIKWTSYLLNNWDSKQVIQYREEYGLNSTKKPSLANLSFVQIDEFYPIPSRQENSFNYYVNKYLI